MFRTLQNALATVGKSGISAVLIAALLGVDTAAAEDISEVSVTNTGKLPVRIVILNTTFGELGRTADFITRSGKVTLQKKVSKYHWEAFARGDPVPCVKQQNVSAPSITVRCDRTKAEENNPVIVGDTKATVPARLKNTGPITFSITVKDHETSKWVFNGDLKAGESKDISITAVKAASPLDRKKSAYYTVIDWEALGVQDGKRMICGSGQITINSEAVPKETRTIEASCKK